MYRCFACDAPAQNNCACYTQAEHPALTMTGRLRQAEDKNHPEQVPQRINIASGEDANHQGTELLYQVEYA